jgi:hypothetical protein
MGHQRAFLAILQERCLGIDSGPYTSQPCDAGFGEERPKPFDTSGRLRSPALLPRTPESNLVAINVNGEPIMSIANRGLLIGADAHVAENEDLRARLPERLRERMRCWYQPKAATTTSRRTAK